MIIKRAMELEMTTQGNPMNEDESSREYWLEWSSWTPCSTTCGEGARLRTRGCMADRVCSGLRYEYSRCRITRCRMTRPDTNLLAIGAIILLNMFMLCCILTPFVIKLIKNTRTSKSLGKQSILSSGSLFPSPILVDEKPKSLKQPNENTIRSHLISDDPDSEPYTTDLGEPLPPPRRKLFSGSPLGTFSPLGVGKQTYANPQRNIVTTEKPESSKGGKPSFVDSGKMPNTKRKVVDVDVEKLYQYRPGIMENERYQYRPGFNDNQHCNVHEYRIESLSEIQDEFRPSPLVENDVIGYRASNLMECQLESYRPELQQEEQPMENYRLNSLDPECITYRPSENLALKESILERADDSNLKSNAPDKADVISEKATERSPIGPSDVHKEPDGFGTKIEKSDLLPEKDANSQVFSEQAESIIDYQDLDNILNDEISTEVPKKQYSKQVSNLEFQERKPKNKMKELIFKQRFSFSKRSPTKQPLLEKPSEDRTTQTSELLSKQSWNSIMKLINEERGKLEPKDEMAKSSGLLAKGSERRQGQKNVSFASSSEVKYISQASSESSEKDSKLETVSSSSSETLFKPRIPKADKNIKNQSSDSSDESTLFGKTNRSNNSKVKQIYKNFVQKFRNKNLNNSSKILKTCSERNLSREMEAINKQDENCQESKSHEPKHENSSDCLPQVFSRSSSVVVSKFISRIDETPRNTHRSEFPADKRNTISNNRLDLADRFVYKFNDDEKSVIKERRKLLCSSDSERCNSNSNNSDF